MPVETQTAVTWSLQQKTTGYQWASAQLITKDNAIELVGKVREYFNIHAISYTSFSYDSLKPYL